VRGTKIGTVADEFGGATLGDERRSTRLLKVAKAIALDPGASFPRAMGSDAELKGFYRFINNDGFSTEAILEPHIRATLERSRRCGTVLVIHDSTFVEVPGSAERHDMGVTTTNNRHGFLAHASLVVDPNGPIPLGIGHLSTLTRTGTKWSARKSRTRVDRSDKTRESSRWIKAVEAIETTRDGAFEAIHVTDAEGDFFEFLSRMRENDTRFVIRAGQLQRGVVADAERESLRTIIDKLRPAVFRKIEVNTRSHSPTAGYKTRRKHPSRTARTARLGIAATTVHVEQSRYCHGAGEPFDINVVRVWELEPPDEQAPIEWVLLTTESVDSESNLLRVVDIYRKRWIIEDYFKALKTGCSLEKRQVDSYDAMRRVLFLLAPLAYRLLLLRGLSRSETEQRASLVFDPTDLLLIGKAQPKPVASPKSLGDALALLAKMGGHITNNGPPGWITLGAGYEKLLHIKLGFELARQFAS
jgi:hypothetical protein